MRNKAFRRFQRSKRIKKFSRLMKHTEASSVYDPLHEDRCSFGYVRAASESDKIGPEAKKEHFKIRAATLARTHTLCSCWMCRSEDGPKISDQKKLLNNDQIEDAKTLNVKNGYNNNL